MCSLPAPRGPAERTTLYRFNFINTKGHFNELESSTRQLETIHRQGQGEMGRHHGRRPRPHRRKT
ncbi:hypothetical protein THIOKS11920006 [Thiocapsa sp. KS1]|nr:hypothetical protein THIOKS11920006 [Thiocapsa sp. KS1]